MAVEDQPAAGPDCLVESAFDAVLVEMLIVQRRRAQELQVDIAMIDARQDAARGSENAGELALARHGSNPIRVGKIFQSDRRIQPFDEATVQLDLVGHGGRVEVADAPVRKSVAGDLMTAGVQSDDVVGIRAVPMVGPLAEQAAGYIEGAA